MLEPRVVPAATNPFELSSLLAANGGTGVTGFSLNAGAESDFFGWAVQSAGDVNGDGVDDLLIGALLANPDGRNGAGATYLVFGTAEGTQASQDLTSLDGTKGFVLNGIAENDRSGGAVSGAGDVNGDGFDDLLIGAYIADPNGSNSGQSYVVFGGMSNLSALDAVTTSGGIANDGQINLADLDGTNGFVLNGIAENDRSGRAVSGAGDVNGDGFDDLLIGATEANPNGSRSGQCYVVFGGTFHLSVLDAAIGSGGTSNDGQINLADLDGTNGFLLNGIAAYDDSGCAVSGAGDVNGDGFDDLLIGALAADPNGSRSGQSYVVFGGTSHLSVLDGATSSGGTANDGRINLADLDGTTGFVLNGIATADNSGYAVSGAGDVNGDGFADLLIGAIQTSPKGSLPGQSYVVFGGAENLDILDNATNSGGAASDGRINLADLNGTTGFVLNGIANGDYSGFAVSGAGDVNGDGFDDLLISARGADPNGTNSGQCYMVFGGAANLGILDDVTSSGGAANDGRINLADLNGTTGFLLNGIAESDLSGRAVSGAGDVNGDGFDDLLIGANGAKLNSSSYGQSYVVFGGNFTGGAETQVGTSGANTLTAHQGAGAKDVLIGQQGADTLVSDGGADVLYGGEGSDTLAIVSTVFQRVSGGSGTDTLRLDGSGLTLNLTTLRDNRLLGIEQIDITGSGNNTLTLNLREVLNLSDKSNTLLVRRNVGDTVNRGSGWTQGANETIGPDTFAVFTQGRATLKVQALNMFAPVLNDKTFSIAENSANNTVVGTMTATDADVIKTLSYSITGGNTLGNFAINSTTGAITVADNTNLDREQAASVVLTV